jgi:16S rRNA (adenine1518-N6/adenine1519-N6)-dimethyltransferase
MNPEELKALLRELNIKPSKSKGQCFLIDEDIARRQIALAGIKDDIVLEVGPGLGVLTSILAEKAQKVIAIEQDKRLYKYLTAKNLKNTELINADALKIDFPKFDKIVSNLPYQVSSPITFKFLDYDFSSAMLMYQKEFAERLVEETGRNSSRLSVKLYYKADSKFIERVPRTAFYPVPDVEGALVRLTPRAPPFKVSNEKLFFKVVDCIYSHRRKKIANCFLLNWQQFSISKDEMKDILRELPYKTKRAEQLEPEEMAELANCLKDNLI